MNISKQLKDLAKNFTVMYVEDDKKLQNKIALSLDLFFKSCITANNGIEALESYKKIKCDIVISDINMPYMDGIDLTKELLQLNKNQIIIIVSAYDDSKYLIKLINLGIKHFILKPIISDNFIKILYTCCQELNKLDNDLIQLSNNFFWNKNKLELQNNGNIIRLTNSEITILNLMILNPYQIFSNEDLYNAIFYNDIEKELSINSIRLIIKRLRKKLPSNMIENIYSKGYKFIINK